MRQLLFVALISLAIEACSPSKSTSTDGCPSGQVSVSGTCRVLCITATECEPAESCSDGLCTPVSSPTCNANTDCTAPEECETLEGARCIAGACTYLPAAESTPCSEVVGASTGVCDGDGSCVQCRNEADCTSWPNPMFAMCYTASCSNSTCAYTPVAPSAAVQCRAASCADGVEYPAATCTGSETPTLVCLTPSGINCGGWKCEDETQCPAEPRSCSSGDQCITGLCDNSVCAPPRAAGVGCDVDGQCESGRCECFEDTCETGIDEKRCSGPSIDCDAACEKIAPDGMSCVALDDSTDPRALCEAGYVCVEGACAETCVDETDLGCALDYHCFSGDGLCYTNLGGSPCDDGSECDSGYCASGLCADKLVLGADCVGDLECASGHCECASADCTSKKCNAIDCTCTFNGDADGLCDDGNINVNTDPVGACTYDCNGAGACEAAYGDNCASDADCGQGTCECASASCTGAGGKKCSAADCAVCKYDTTSYSDASCTANINANEDPNNACTGGDCNGAGACEVVDGTSCTSDSECTSGRCECASADCSTKKCNTVDCSCTYNTDADGVCDDGNITANTDPAGACSAECNGSGACEAADGTTCTSDAECTSAHCECANAGCTAKKCNAVDCTCTFNSDADGACDDGNITVNTDPAGACSAECNGSGACEVADGTACSSDADCTNAHCECANAGCTAKKCNAIDCTCTFNTDTDGLCDDGNITANTDPASACSAECNGSGACEAADGTTCTSDAECSSAKCECASADCSTKKCNAVDCTCTFNNDADGLCDDGNITANTDPAGACSAECNGSGACEVADGTTCTSDAECTSGKCECANAGCTAKMCNAVDCSCTFNNDTDGLCDDGNITANTDPASACSAECNGSGACEVADGTACTSDAECTSAKCECANAGCTAKKCNAVDCSCTFNSDADGACDDGNITANTDPAGACSAECNGSGACEVADGTACTSDAECTSAKCECANAGCTAKKCNAIDCSCTFNTDADGLCDDGNITANTDPVNACANECNGSGACEVAAGGSCSANADCDSGRCECGDEACGSGTKRCGGTTDCVACQYANASGACVTTSDNTDPGNACGTDTDCYSGACSPEIATITVTGSAGSGGGSGSVYWVKLDGSGNETATISATNAANLFASTNWAATLTANIGPGECFAVHGSEGSNSITRTFAFSNGAATSFNSVALTMDTAKIVRTTGASNDEYTRFCLSGTTISATQVNVPAIVIETISITGSTTTSGGGSSNSLYWVKVDASGVTTATISATQASTLYALSSWTATLTASIGNGECFALRANEGSAAVSKTYTFSNAAGTSFNSVSTNLDTGKVTLYPTTAADEYTRFCLSGSTISTSQATDP